MTYNVLSGTLSLYTAASCPFYTFAVVQPLNSFRSCPASASVSPSMCVSTIIMYSVCEHELLQTTDGNFAKFTTYLSAVGDQDELD